MDTSHAQSPSKIFREKKKETAYSQRKRALCFPRRRIQYADIFVANDFSSPNWYMHVFPQVKPNVLLKSK
jgi:hypothetical protein